MKFSRVKYALKTFIKRDEMNLVKKLLAVLSITAVAVSGVVQAAAPEDGLPNNLKSLYQSNKLDISFQYAVTSCQKQEKSLEQCLNEIDKKVYEVPQRKNFFTEEQYKEFQKYPDVNYRQFYIACVKYNNRSGKDLDCVQYGLEQAKKTKKINLPNLFNK